MLGQGGKGGFHKVQSSSQIMQHFVISVVVHREALQLQEILNLLDRSITPVKLPSLAMMPVFILTDADNCAVISQNIL